MAEKKLNIKGILIFSIGISLVLILITTGFIMYRNSKKNNETNPGEYTGIFYTVGEFMTNLNNEGAKRYIRVTIEAELVNKQAEKLISGRLTEIRNNVILILNAYSAEQLNSTAGKQELSEKIGLSINSTLQGNAVLKIYFTSFIIQ